MKTRFIPVLVVLSVAMIGAIPLFAKRAAPKEVAAIEKDGIVYTAPQSNMGCVEARFKKTSGLFWKKQIYVVKYMMDLESDVQDCFIKELKFEAGKILVVNEAGYQYQLDPESLEVTAAKGSLVIDRNKKEK